jgi:hypothetical protein
MPTHLDHHIAYEDTPRPGGGRRLSPLRMRYVFLIALAVTLLLMLASAFHAW